MRLLVFVIGVLFISLMSPVLASMMDGYSEMLDQM